MSEHHHHHWYYYGTELAGLFAAVLSWLLNKSVGYAVLHFFCSWFYLLYALIARTEELDAILQRLLS